MQSLSHKDYLLSVYVPVVHVHAIQPVIPEMANGLLAD